MWRAVGNYDLVRFIEIRDYDFLLTGDGVGNTTNLYERASLYFGDVDENGVPLYITDPCMRDYPYLFRAPKYEDIPGYDEEFVKRFRG